jgi:hypothetical protein
MKQLLLTLALPFMLAPAPVSTEYNLAGGHGIERVDCTEGAGTAFRVGPRLYVSVAHVTGMSACKVDGEPLTITYRHGDFSAFTVPDASKEWLKIDCGGFVAGRHYIALGYARGLDTEASVDLTGTPFSQNDEAILLGVFTVQPGQSGGPIVDAGSGEVVGTVNAADWEQGVSFSVPLKGTKLCPGS